MTAIVPMQVVAGSNMRSVGDFFAQRAARTAKTARTTSVRRRPVLGG